MDAISKSKESESKKVGAVLIIGGGISGMQYALDLADSGFKVYVLDSSPSIGGAMSQLDKTFPTNDCAMCIMAPKLVETGRHHNIQLLTNADLESVEGEAGNFKVTITKRPRYVDESRCTGCGICTQRCPIEVKDEYNKGLKRRKAIHVKYPQAVPPVHCIDQEICIGCGLCETQCEAEAIKYSQEKREIEIAVGSIILSPGFEEFDILSKRKEYGYGKFPNVISSLEMERMLSATGPFNGLVLRLSDGEIPKRVAFIQCVGSRDRTAGNPYCSSVCCMFAIKEAVIAQEHAPGLKSTIFFMDMRAFGKEFDDYYIRAEEEHGIRFVKNNRVSGVNEDKNTNNLILNYVHEGVLNEEEFDLVVLSVGMDSPSTALELAEKLGVELNDYNFCKTSVTSPLETNMKGIFVSGAFSAPKDIPDTVAQASGAAACASSLIASERDKLVEVKEYPPEKEVAFEEPRMGVFICHCGINIGGVVKVPDVVEYVKTLPNVVYAESNPYTCSQDTQQNIKSKIEDHNLNRVVVASCTPRTHEPLFQNTVREAGLNPYFFEMANIRDQCSWVHMHEPEAATKKAMDLVRMAISKTRLLEPLYKVEIPINQSALVIGGGISGMMAALELAEHGFAAHIVEKEKELGGNLRRLHFMLTGENLQEFLKETIDKINSNNKINVYVNSDIKNIEGCVGDFKTTISENDEEKVLEHGAVIVATGGISYQPKEYLYGQDERIITQLDFEERLGKGQVDADTVVMIQCVGSRDENRTYCSRVCCSEAVKNALKLKELNPKANIYILYKDMRTYGFREIFYEEAARSGIVFIRYYDDGNPDVQLADGSLSVSIFDHYLGEDIDINPDLLVLSTATIPSPDNQKIAKMLKVPLSKDGFFLEAHMKLRPLDFATEGVFLCGLAHSPKFLEECISQAKGTVSRAATLLSKKFFEANAVISVVDEMKCRGCGECIDICEFGAPELITDDKGNKRSKINEALCKGCGACAASCCNNAIITKHFKNDQIHTMIDSAVEDHKLREEFEPFILAFCCNWCAYAGADLAGVSRFQYPPNIRVIRVMCSGRVAPSFIMEAIHKGVDGVLVAGCHIGDCHYISGNEKAEIRVKNVKELIGLLGMDERRVRLEWISASEGKRFADIMTEFAKEIRELGPNPLNPIEQPTKPQKEEIECPQ
ncbi:MAG: hydrogenase iron-sulfur subunit [Thermoplasmata archaeon]|nr:MAG: hydrogenase iron-sulfur subunit [Thermoplasmata archaeon]